MKSSALIRHILLPGYLMLLALAAHAGSIDSVFVPQYNDPALLSDDRVVQMPLHWYSGADLRFYYFGDYNTGAVLTLPVNNLNDPTDIIMGVQRSIKRWNDYYKSVKSGAGTNITIWEGITNVDDPHMPPPVWTQPTTMLPYVPVQAAIDGISFIDFQATYVTAQMPAMTIVSYFDHDFDLADQIAQGSFPDQNIGSIITDPAGVPFVNITLPGIDPNLSSIYLFIPNRNYKQGEIFDVDIAFNDAVTAAGGWRAWGDSPSSVPAGARGDLNKTLDMDMVMMHEMGWALGLGNSMIYDSVMYPYYFTLLPNGQPQYPFTTDQFRKRLLSFDDQLTACLAWGVPLGANTGTITGEVLDGAIIGATTPTGAANGFITSPTPTPTPAPTATPAPGTTPAPTPLGAPTVQAPTNPFIVQVPVMVGVKAPSQNGDPGQLSKVPALTLGRYDSSVNHPDNILSVSASPADVNQGNWRMMAQVMTGQDLSVPYDVTLLGTIPDQGFGPPGAGTGLPNGGLPTGPGAIGTVVNLVNPLEGINSNYTIPGLPATDSAGAPVNYAVYLPHDILYNGTAMFDITTFFANPVQSLTVNGGLNGLLAVGLYAYTNEFYGGTDIPLEFGKGNAPIDLNAFDNKFMNNYIIGEMDIDGRISASINQGPTLLSGYNIGPRSYFAITYGSNTYTNQIGPVGNVVTPVVVQDQRAPGVAGVGDPGATGEWVQPNQFDIKTQMQFSDKGGLVGIPAGLQMSYTISNLTSDATTFTFRQVLDTNLFGRENPVYVVNNSVVQRSTSYQGSAIPAEILFQSWTNPETAIRGFVDVSGGQNTPPSWVTIGTLGELAQIIPPAGGITLRDARATNRDSGIALGWKFRLSGHSQITISYTFGFYPGGQVVDTWYPRPNPVPVGTRLSGFEDDPLRVTPVNVQPGKVTDGIDIITNNGAAIASATLNPPREGSSAISPLKFYLLANGFPNPAETKDYLTMGGALADIDNDGDLDVVTCAMAGSNPGSGSMNRIYLNERRINGDGSVTRYFRDVTLGENPNDPTGYRLPQPAHLEDSVCVLVADFDDDGWPEIVVINRNAPSRYYDNMGPEKPGYFVEDPGALPEVFNGAAYMSPLGLNYEVPFRAVAGDIDCDGDLDIIISEFEPLVPLDPSTGLIAGYHAWLDDSDGRFNHSTDYWSNDLAYAERVLINYKYTPAYAKNFNLDKRKSLTDNIGTYFVDETLGSDDRPGTMSSLKTQRDPISYILDPGEFQAVLSWDPSEIDRMPPIFPRTTIYAVTANFAPTSINSPMATQAIEPRLGPLFGGGGLDLMSIRVGAQAPYDSVTRPVQEVVYVPPSNAPPYFLPVAVMQWTEATGIAYGADNAFFRNLDIFSNEDSLGTPQEVIGDGIPDGYFACMNYNMDVAATIQTAYGYVVNGIAPQSTGGGLFCYEQDNESTLTSALLRHDAIPLFIGVPAAHPANGNNDVMAPTPALSYCGLIGDWENRNRPLPLLITDLGAAPYMYGPSTTPPFGDVGFERGGINYGGLATQYFEPAMYPFTQHVPLPGIPTAWLQRPMAPLTVVPPGTPAGVFQAGQPYGAAAGDFDCDGDQDVLIANNSLLGINNQFTDPARKQVLLNDGFGVFTEVQGALIPDETSNAMGCAVGDLDNDGDLDLVIFNMLGPNEAFMNQTFTSSPNPMDDKDPTMFYDASAVSLPNIAAGANNDVPGDLTFGPFSGMTIGANVVDLNMDGRPDILLTEGGQGTKNGDYVRVLINGGKPVGDGVPIYKPGGAAYPGPRQDLWLHNLVTPLFTAVENPDPSKPPVKVWAPAQRPGDFALTSFLLGYMGGPKPGYINDVITADVNGDGNPDVLVVRATGTALMYDGPQLLVNQTSNDPFLNNQPNPDGKGDGIFADGNLVKLTDPGMPVGGNYQIRKNQGQKAKFADLDHDGLPDIIIANGYPSDTLGRGAPNVILMNHKTTPGHFTDETETRLPAITEDGVTHGIFDNTIDLAVGDFEGTGNIDIIFANDATTNSPTGFRFLHNNGAGVFTDLSAVSHFGTDFHGRHVQRIMVADLDGLGEPTEDKNFNGVLDPGEDTNGNGRIDWVDLPTETEDLNGNGILDPGEDGLIGPPNGKIDTQDLNNDGILTARRAGQWDGSLDLMITFDNDYPALMINDPTNQHPGTFTDQTFARMPGVTQDPSRGLDIGDVNLDGYPDIVIAQFVGGVTRPVKTWLNQPKIQSGHVGWGYFKDVSYEVPYPWGMAQAQDIAIPGRNDEALTGWATDVKLLDIDGDGDLDMFVATLGLPNRTLRGGAPDFMYINRTIGDGFNFKGYAAQKTNGNPNVFAINPSYAKRGTRTDVTVTGENLQLSTRISFGSGIDVMGLKVLDQNSISVTLDVKAAATLGPRSVLVQNPSGSASATKSGMFNVYDKLPLIQNDIPKMDWSLYQ